MFKSIHPLSYQQIAKDIVATSARGNDLQTQAQVSEMCKVAGEFMAEFTARSNGYMLMTFFIVSFTELKKTAKEADTEDRQLVEDIMKAIIGSFGRTIN